MARQPSHLLTGGDPAIRRDDPEPSIDELLDDPIAQLLMKRDGLRRAELLATLRIARSSLGLARVRDDNHAPALL